MEIYAKLIAMQSITGLLVWDGFMLGLFVHVYYNALFHGSVDCVSTPLYTQVLDGDEGAVVVAEASLLIYFPSYFDFWWWWFLWANINSLRLKH